jgi:hypothetical protein
MQYGEGVRIIASNSLFRADLSADWRLMNLSPDYTLTSVMRDLIIIDAADYPTAFAHLFKKWSPDAKKPQRSALTMGQPTIEAGRLELEQ